MKLDSIFWLLAAVMLGSIVFFAVNPPMPNDAVLRAAKSMTPEPVVSRAGFAFWGCSEDDLFRFEVTTQSGESVGYICQGLFLKGATPRY